MSHSLRRVSPQSETKFRLVLLFLQELLDRFKELLGILSGGFPPVAGPSVLALLVDPSDLTELEGVSYVLQMVGVATGDGNSKSPAVPDAAFTIEQPCDVCLDLVSESLPSSALAWLHRRVCT